MTEDAAPAGAPTRAPGSVFRRRPPGSIPWDEIRAAYEGSDVALHLVASAYGIGVTDIYPRADREGWQLRRRRWALERKARRTAAGDTPARIDRSDLVERMFRAVERQIEDIELRSAERDGEPDERDARTLGALARTLELLIGMETAEAAKQTEGRRDIDDLRRDLARRIEGLRGG